jgi:hypothetical protein
MLSLKKSSLMILRDMLRWDSSYCKVGAASVCSEERQVSMPARHEARVYDLPGSQIYGIPFPLIMSPAVIIVFSAL